MAIDPFDKLSVEVGLTLMGFEQLGQIENSLLKLSNLAKDTTEALNQLGRAYQRAMSRGSAETSANISNLERMAREARRTSDAFSQLSAAKKQAFEPVSPAQAREAVPHRTVHGPRGELMAGLMGGLGVSAFIGISEAARHLAHAAVELDTQTSSLRQLGYSEQQIAQIHAEALKANVPTMTTAQKEFVGQELGSILGPENVNAQLLSTIATLATSIGSITKTGTPDENIRNLLRGVEQMGNITGPNGKFDLDKIKDFSFAFNSMIGAGGGQVTASTLAHNIKQFSAFGIPMNVGSNKELQAMMTVASERLGSAAGQNLKALFDQISRGPRSAQQREELLRAGMLDTSKIQIGVDPLTNKPIFRMQNTIAGMDIQNHPVESLVRFRNAMEDLAKKELHGTRPVTETDIMQQEQKFFTDRGLRAFEGLLSPSGLEAMERARAQLDRMPHSLDDVQHRMQSFNFELHALETSFGNLAAEAGGPFLHDATIALKDMSEIVQRIAEFAGSDSGQVIVTLLTKMAEIAAVMAGIRFAPKVGAAALRLFGIGGGSAAAAAGVTDAAGMAVGGAAVEGAAVGGLAGLMGLTTSLSGPIAILAGATIAVTEGFSLLHQKLVDLGVAFDSIDDHFKKRLIEEREKNHIKPMQLPSGFDVTDNNKTIFLNPFSSLTPQQQIDAATRKDYEKFIHDKSFKDKHSPLQAVNPEGLEQTIHPPTSLPTLSVTAQKPDNSIEARAAHEAHLRVQAQMNQHLGAPYHVMRNHSLSEIQHRNEFLARNGGTQLTPRITPDNKFDLRHLTPRTITTDQIIVRGASPVPGAPSGAPMVVGSPNAAVALPGSPGVNVSLTPVSPVGSVPLPGSGASPSVPSSMQSVPLPGSGGIPSGPSGALSTESAPVSGLSTFSLPSGTAPPNFTRGAFGGTTPNFSGANVPNFVSPGQTFAQKAPAIAQQLQKDLGLTPVQAAAIVGNLGLESGGFKFFHEIGQASNQGGIGWAQWTGARRRQFEAFAQANGLDPHSDKANMAFLEWELTHTEKNALDALKRQTTLSGGTAAFAEGFERPGVLNLQGRLNYAEQALNIINRGQQQIDPRLAEMPTTQFHHTTHNYINIDGETVAEHIAHQMIGGGPTTSPGATGYDSKMMPMAPGTSTLRI